MMGELSIGMVSALWLGILTSISPCPLATNIAAISYIGRRVGNPRQVFLTGMLYTAGRMLTYLALGFLLVASVMSIPQVSMFLQKHMHVLLGPILILVGMVLLGLLSVPLPNAGGGGKVQKHADAWGIWGALLLGVVFALSFCPVSAALFFGSLIPLSVQVNSSIAIPSLYGLGTALPVIVFAVLLAVSAKSVGKAFNVLTKIEWWARMATGGIFLAVGLFFSLRYIFGVI